jgi:AcrR family transcriptional regulator
MAKPVPAAPNAEVVVDGRRARGVRTRAAIVDALLALVDEGNVQPTAGQIAARAGVALRSIRQHFATRDELLLAGAAKHAARIEGAHDGVGGDGPLADRLRRFVEARAGYLEATSGVRRAAVLHAAGSKVVAAGARALQRERRREIERAFAPELDALDADRRATAVGALHVYASGTTWDALRVDAGQSHPKAMSILHDGLGAMLRGFKTRPA